MPSPKRPKVRRREAAAANRISELPDSILAHILSLLPIENAIKTEVLSKRWQFLWTCVPSLVFRYSYTVDEAEDADENNTRNKEFVTFVQKTLLLSNCSKIKKFGVEFDYEPRFASNVNSWTRFAAAKGIEDLSLELQDYMYESFLYELPQLLYYQFVFQSIKVFFVRSRAQRSCCLEFAKEIVNWTCELE